jgi:hypothetical protein
MLTREEAVLVLAEVIKIKAREMGDLDLANAPLADVIAIIKATDGSESTIRAVAEGHDLYLHLSAGGRIS